MQIVPAIDVLENKVVRLQQGDFKRRTDFGNDPVALAESFAVQGSKVLHLVNLSGSRDGTMGQSFLDIVRNISKRTELSVQVGGGIRSIRDIYKLFEVGVEKVVLGTALFTDSELVKNAKLLFGSERFIAALDVQSNEIRISGWQESSGIPLYEGIKRAKSFGISNILITDISRDGMEQGPNVPLYKKILKNYPKLNIIASGGVRNASDIRSLKDVGCSSVIVGRALISGQVTFTELKSAKSDLAIRIVPCLDVSRGRTVKGTKFQNLRDAGDPVELAKRYCKEGADELVFLDISATRKDKETVFELVSRVAEEVNIPFTIGGGIRSVEDARRLLETGADKVSINSAAVKRPQLLSEIAEQLGSANTVCAIDARRKGKSWVVLVKGGTEEIGIDALKWAEEAIKRGAGELLVTSFDRDGTGIGFDTELLANIKERVNVPIIASGGAGSLQDFVDAVAVGKADALLAASVFHFQKYSISDVKQAILNASLPVRI
ncbi:MAG: imidazole glycerol phosphate synthase subunit HisF [Candidatus Peribacteraceae bacterium]|jgi:phosphoribosylformimino-5-aminoimidazole carboxamide ribotide isomerase|nr:imidazole glycerol phosphate synthase subunit HisF [Candidatus Peribacteraceae bacterium]